jgi:hypothetical protein
MSKKTTGVSVIEILIVVLIITLCLLGLVALANFSLLASQSYKNTTIAESLARGEIEAIRNFRDGTTWDANGLGTVLLDTVYHLGKTADNPPKWQLISGQEDSGIFSRKVIFSSVLRDSNDNIVMSGGTIDPGTKKAVVTVSWQERARSHQIVLTAYFTNWQSP